LIFAPVLKLGGGGVLCVVEANEPCWFVKPCSIDASGMPLTGLTIAFMQCLLDESCICMHLAAGISETQAVAFADASNL
jgi:hypothetical protein